MAGEERQEAMRIMRQESGSKILGGGFFIVGRPNLFRAVRVTGLTKEKDNPKIADKGRIIEEDWSCQEYRDQH